MFILFPIFHGESWDVLQPQWGYTGNLFPLGKSKRSNPTIPRTHPAEALDGLRMCHVSRLHGVAADEGALIRHRFAGVSPVFLDLAYTLWCQNSY